MPECMIVIQIGRNMEGVGDLRAKEEISYTTELVLIHYTYTPHSVRV